MVKCRRDKAISSSLAVSPMTPIIPTQKRSIKSSKEAKLLRSLSTPTAALCGNIVALSDASRTSGAVLNVSNRSSSSTVGVNLDLRQSKEMKS